MTSSLESLLGEVEGQPRILGDFVQSRLPRAGRGSLFVGAGDSYAVALGGFYASKGRCIALDPYSLASYPKISENLDVFFISISGRTKSNLKAAKIVKGLARQTTAVTAVDSSGLGEATDRVVKLPMVYVPRTPGILSFSLSLMAVLKISGWDVEGDFRRALRRAEKDRGTALSAAGTTYMLGNSLAYPVALYAAAKRYELLGTRAHAELLEEFSHLELFSLERDDAVNLMSAFDPSGLAPRLAGTLEAAGYRSSVIPRRGKTDAERLFHAVFVAQYSAIDQARRSGFKEPKFLSATERLSASDTMIY